jgi:hypothetical protein
MVAACIRSFAGFLTALGGCWNWDHFRFMATVIQYRMVQHVGDDLKGDILENCPVFLPEDLTLQGRNNL